MDMTREEAYKEWVAAGQDFCYTNIDLWNAACEWQEAQTKNDVIFHLNEDRDGDFFLTKESFMELFIEVND